VDLLGVAPDSCTKSLQELIRKSNLVVTQNFDSFLVSLNPGFRGQILYFSTIIPSKINKMGLSYPVFMPKSSTHRMHDPGSIVPHIRPKVLTDNQIS
jgi:hypothetical protein